MRPEDCESVLVNFNGKKLTFSFPSSYLKLLSEIGRKVQSLIFEIDTSSLEPIDGIEQLVEIVESCPSLQDLKLDNVNHLFFSGSTDYQNFELKSLSLQEYNNSIGSLEAVSSIFPNLERLHLFISPQYDDFETTTIDMPNTSFDVLKCNCSRFGNGTGKIYIKLKTDAGLQFYSATNKGQLQQINEKEYDHLHIAISCRSLTKL